MSGVPVNKPRTLASTVANDVSLGTRSYFGGASDFTALITVVREIPNRRAIAAFGTPSPASLLISAQSSNVITLPMLSGVHFSPGRNRPEFERHRHLRRSPRTQLAREARLACGDRGGEVSGPAAGEDAGVADDLAEHFPEREQELEPQSNTWARLRGVTRLSALCGWCWARDRCGRPAPRTLDT